jgi:hypothetical protein
MTNTTTTAATHTTDAERVRALYLTPAVAFVIAAGTGANVRQPFTSECAYHGRFETVACPSCVQLAQR